MSYPDLRQEKKEEMEEMALVQHELSEERAYNECLSELDELLEKHYLAIANAIDSYRSHYHIDEDIILSEMVMPSIEAKITEMRKWK